MSVSMSCLHELYFLHRCGVRGRTWAFPVSGNLEFLLLLYFVSSLLNFAITGSAQQLDCQIPTKAI